MSYGLSKSRYQTGLTCPRALWLKVHEPELADPVTEAQQALFDSGHAVGRLAHGLFPGGVEVAEDHRHCAEALDTTRRLIAEGTRVLYEPAFERDGVLVRVDLLAHIRDDIWDLYEVKSSTRLKPEHITDAAVQTWVVEGAGLRIRRIHIVHLDASYTYPGDGRYDPRSVLAVENVTRQARAHIDAVPGTVRRFQEMLAGPIPDTPIGCRCDSPYTCAFKTWCHGQRLPHSRPVTQMPRLYDGLLHSLLEAGFTELAAVPESFPGLRPSQRDAIQVARTNRAIVDHRRIEEALREVAFPVHLLDFETLSPALPVIAGTGPYQQVPFQYSMHVIHADGTLEQRSYLHVDATDPRRPLAERLLADLGSEGSIVHYTSFEPRIIDSLAIGVPVLATPLLALADRFIDLERIVRANVRHPDARGRTSIKYVLPALCPDLSYDGLAIADGRTAAVRYLKAVTGELTEAEAAQVFADLEEYCGLDTYAMVRLLRELERMAGGEPEA